MDFFLTKAVKQALKDVALPPIEARLMAADERAARQTESLQAQIATLTTQLSTLGTQLSSFRERAEELLMGIPKRRIRGDADEYARLNPEIGLMKYLYSFLPCRVAIDIGANIGDYSERLLQAGYKVFAFEPSPAVFDKLQVRHGQRGDFHAARLAVGEGDRTMALHVAADHSGGKYDDSTLFSSLVPHAMFSDLVFEGSVEVPVRSLESLHRSGELPAEVGLVKIDTEGYELQVMRGMGARRYPVVLAEFWDEKFPFSDGTTCNRLQDMVGEMRGRGYHWFLAFYRIGAGDDVIFFSNHPKSPDNSWGNVCFFQEFSLFQRARDWCALWMQEAIFGP